MANGDLWILSNTPTAAEPAPLIGTEQGAGPVIAWSDGRLVTYTTSDGLASIGAAAGPDVIQWLNKRVQQTIANHGTRSRGVIVHVFRNAPSGANTVAGFMKRDADGLYMRFNDLANEVEVVSNS